MDKINKKIIFAIVIIAVIISGLMSSYNLLITRGYSSKVYGSLGLSEFVKKVNDEELIFTFDKFQISGSNYIYTKSTETKITDLSKYSITLNNYNATNEVSNKNSLYGNVKIAFINYRNEILDYSNCQISLSLRENTLTFVLSVNDYTSIELWNDYFKTNNIKIKLINKVSFENEETVIEKKEIKPIEPNNDVFVEDDYIKEVEYTHSSGNMSESYNFTELVNSSVIYGEDLLSIIELDTNISNYTLRFNLYIKIRNETITFNNCKFTTADKFGSGTYASIDYNSNWISEFKITEDAYLTLKVKDNKLYVYLVNISGLGSISIYFR